MDSPVINVQPVQKKSNKGLCIIVAVIFILFFCVGSCIGLWLLLGYAGQQSSKDTNLIGGNLETETVYGDAESKNKILEIPINGTILNAKPSNDFLSFTSQVTYGYEVKEMLIKAAKDPEIKGVLLEINSPGGTMTGGKAIVDGIDYYRLHTKNPIYAHVMGMGASAAYWSASATDYIVADYGSLVGSIGVVFGPFKHYNTVLSDQNEGVTTKDGIESFYIFSGGYKDVGSPDRVMTDYEKKIFQNATDNAYEMFVDYVSSHRKISATKIKTDIKALPYGEQQALDFKLIDKIGSVDSAYQDLATKLGFKENEYQIARVKSNADFWGMLFGGNLFKSLQVSNAKTLDISEELKGKVLFLYDIQGYLK